MASDLFGGLVKGLGSFVPKDDPKFKLFSARTEMNELENREMELYAQIGKKAYDSICNNPEYSDMVTELTFIRKKREDAESQMQQAQEDQSEKEKKEQKQLQNRTCSNCYALNPDGVKFCQECGSRLSVNQMIACLECGAEHPAGTRFCGECGRQL